MQETKRKEISIKRHTISSLNSITNSNRNKIKHSKRNHRKTRKSLANVNFLTTNSLKSLSSIKISSITETSPFYGQVTQVIEDIYPLIADDISVFMQPNFGVDTDPADFLQWMLECYEDLYSDDNWSITNENKWILVRARDYPILEDNTCPEFRFLYTKEKHEDYQRINNLFILFLSLVYQNNGAMWWNSYFHDMTTDQIFDRYEETKTDPKYFEKETIEEIKDTVKEIEFLASLQKEIEANTITLVEFKGLINEFKPINTVEKRCIETFKNVIDTVSLGVNPAEYSFSFESEEEYSPPLKPCDYSIFSWEVCEDGGLIGLDISMYMTSYWNEGGTSPFRDLIINEKEDSGLKEEPFMYYQMMEELQELTNYLN
jgi:hypothetical protein